jgi:hypothetical protein
MLVRGARIVNEAQFWIRRQPTAATPPAHAENAHGVLVTFRFFALGGPRFFDEGPAFRNGAWGRVWWRLAAPIVPAKYRPLAALEVQDLHRVVSAVVASKDRDLLFESRFTTPATPSPHRDKRDQCATRCDQRARLWHRDGGDADERQARVGPTKDHRPG